VGMRWCERVPKQNTGRTRRILSIMEKRNLKTLIAELEQAIAEIKAEVYSDPAAYHIDRDDGIKSYAQINDQDGECD